MLRLVFIGLLTSFALQAWSTDVSDVAKLREEYHISPSCSVAEEKISSKIHPDFIEFWCDGELAYRFEDMNTDGLVDQMESFIEGTHILRKDSNFDGKIDLIRYKKPDGENMTVVEERDQDLDGTMDGRRKFVTSLTVEERTGCYETYQGDEAYEPLSYTINSLVGVTPYRFPQWKTMMDYDCRPGVARTFEKGIRAGYSCLKQMDTPLVRRMLCKIDSFIKYAKKPIRVRCDQQIRRSAVAEATLRGSRDYPQIRLQKSFNFDSFARSSYADGSTFFHEFLHVTLNEGHSHVDGMLDIDHVIACDTCCFGSSGYTNVDGAGKQAACTFCNGTNTNTNDWKAFRKLYGIGPHVQGPSGVAGRIQSPQLRAAYLEKFDTNCSITLEMHQRQGSKSAEESYAYYEKSYIALRPYRKLDREQYMNCLKFL